MSKANRFLLASALSAMAFLIPACETAKEGPEEEGGQQGSAPVTLTLSSTVQSRTILGDLVDGVYRVFWCNGDRICVNGVKSSVLYGIQDSTTTASFSVSGVEAPYSIFYPSICCDAMSDDGVASITIPVSQKYTPGSFPEGSAMLYGFSDGEESSLTNLCGVIKIPLTAFRTAKLKSIEVMSKSPDDPIAGRFTLNPRSGALTPVSGSASLLLSMPAEGVELSQTDTVFFCMAVHAGDYPAGFNIRFTDTQDRSMVVEWSESTAIEAGVIAKLKAVEFDPSTALEIVDIDTWEQFAAAANAGDWSEWANKNGEVNLLGNISVAGEITPIENWDGVFKGNGFTISRGNACNPIFKTIAKGAVVKDLIVAGTCNDIPDDDHKYRVYDVDYAKFVCPLACTNYGTISNCTGKVDFSLNNMNSIFYLGGLVMFNAGVMESCSNEGSIIVRYQVDNRRWGSIGGLACFGSDGVASHNTYPSGYRDIESAGTFLNCSNKADILVTKKTSSTSGSTHYIAGFDLGGICATVNAGTKEHPALFKDCSNSGNISFLEYEIQSTTQYDYACGLAGIVSCVGNHTPLWKDGGTTLTTSWYEIPSDYPSYSDDTPAGYVVDIKNCSNTGALEFAARSGNNRASTIAATGVTYQRRQGFFGGIAAYCYGLPDRPVAIENCSNTGSMRFSERYIGTGGGGLVGAASYVAFKNCTVNVGEDKKIAPSVQPDWYVPKTAGSNYRAAGFFGGIFGISYADVKVESCKSFLYIDYPLTTAGNGQTASYIRYPGMLFGIVVPGASVTIDGNCSIGGHIMTYLYNPGSSNLDKKYLLVDLDRDSYSEYICYRDVYDYKYKDMWVSSGSTPSLLVAITDTNFGTVTGKDNVIYWDGK